MNSMEIQNQNEHSSNHVLIQGFDYTTNKNTDQKIRIQITSDPKFLKAFRNFIYEISIAYGIKPNLSFDLKLLCTEVVNNIIKHSYKNSPKGWIFIEYLFYTTYVEIRFRDYSRFSIKKKDFIAKDLTEFRESGLGLYLISKLSDYYYFDSNEDLGNLFVIKKRI